MKRWFLVQVRPNADQMAKQNLTRQGFETFQPMEMRTILRRSKFVEELRPFFSGYLFVTYPSESVPWSLVNSTYGVSRVVKFGNRPAMVPSSVMAEILQACDTNGVLSVRREVSVGDIVEIIRGPLGAFIGEVQHLRPEQRAMILLDIIGRQTKVTISTADLRSVS